MPDRIVRSAIITSDRVNALSWSAEIFYRRLMSVADDYGRFDGRPSILRAQLYPLKLDKVSESDIRKWIRECEEAALVRCYSVEGKGYTEILRFGQRMRAATSKYPPPPSSADSCPQPADIGCQIPSEAEAETHAKADIAPAPPARVRNVVFDALATACGSKPSEMTKRQLSSCGVALSEIRKTMPDVADEPLVKEIDRRATAYRRKYPAVSLTPNALCAHWGEFPAPERDKRWDPLPEPTNWADLMREHYPQAVYVQDGTVSLPWLRVSRHAQQSITEALGRLRQVATANR